VITEQELVGLVQRADWTKLSLTATVSRRFNRALRDEQLRSMPPPPWQPPWVVLGMADPDDMPTALGDQVTGRLTVAPGCRFREELTDENGDTVTSGCDGNRVWVVNPRIPREPVTGHRQRGVVRRVYAGGSPHPPFRQLLSPSWLLTAAELRVEGAVDFGRQAWRVVAVPRARRPTVLGPQRYDLTVDAELGILLRCEAFLRGVPLSVEELDALRIQPADAADESLFLAPPDALANVPEFATEHAPPGLGTVAGLAADALAFAIRYGPGGPRRPPEDVADRMPDDADDAGQDHWSPVSDQTAYLLYRASSVGADIAAEFHEWMSAEGLGVGLAQGLRRGEHLLGQGGVGRLADAISDKAAPGTTHRVARVSYAADGIRYRLEWIAGAPPGKPATEACDGQTRYRVYPDRTLTGPARPAPSRLAALGNPSWLLEWRLADGGEETVDGRPGFRVRATRIQGVTLRGPSPICDAAVAVIDAELGLITRLTSYASGKPVERWELRDVRWAAPGFPEEEFRIETPPGGRVEQEKGPLDEAPEPLREVVRTAEQIGRAIGPVVSKAAGFLGSLRSRGQP
jgi:hypothetical protein